MNTFQIEMIVLITFLILLNSFQMNGSPISEENGDVLPLRSNSHGDPESQDKLLFPNVPEGRALVKRGNNVRWTNGIVPYVFEPGYAVAQENFIIGTMLNMERLVAINNITCIHFRPKNATDIYFITFRNAAGCSSYVGQNTGLNFTRYVTLAYPGCFSGRTIMHELLHALGFYHEQSRPDRDNYVRINYTNIQSGYQSNFNYYNNTYADTLNTSYDYSSVMHYGEDAFSANGFATIEALQNVSFGSSNISATDILATRIFYNCSASGTPLPSIPAVTLPNLYVVNTTVSSAWTSSDRLFARYNYGTQGYYYHIYSLVVPVTGYYVIMTANANDSYGYIYFPSFNAGVPSSNLIAYDDNSGGNLQFQMIMNLQASTTYMIVVTTAARNRTGPYTLIVSGLYAVSLNRVPDSNTTTTTNTTSSTPASDGDRQTVIIIVASVVGGVFVVVLVVLALQKCIS